MAGHLDVIKMGLIEGWVYDPAAPNTPQEIEVCLDGRRIASCVANIFRQDLKDAGLGDGSHAFRLCLPTALMANNVLEVRESATGIPLEGSPINIIQAPPAAHVDYPNLVLDLTDLIWHMNQFENMTGIPRVVDELIEAIFNFALYDLDKISFITMDYHAHTFFKVSNDSFLAFLDRYRQRNNLGMPSRKEDGYFHIENYLEYTPFSPSKNYLQNTVMLTLGSSLWGIPYYFGIIRSYISQGMKFIPLFHDIIPLMAPELSPPDMSDRFNMFFAKALRASAHILTVSRHCAQDIATFAEEAAYFLPPVTPIGNGEDTRLGEPGTVPPVARPFVLSVGTLERRKNHILLLRVWKKLIAQYGEQIPTLVLVGKPGIQIKEMLDLLKGTNFLNQKVKILTSVSDDELEALYANCLFTAVPSLYEGWGLPVSESLAHGKTCLCSNTSSLPEAGGEFCVYFNPLNFQDCLEKATKLIFEDNFRQNMEAKIKQDFRPNSWRSVAEKILQIVRQTVNNPAPATPLFPAGEYAFWTPAQMPAGQSNGITDIIDFGAGKLSTKGLTWNNYALADEMIVRGAWSKREKQGILAEQGLFHLSFKPDSAIIPTEMGILIALAGPGNQPLTVNISHKGMLLKRVNLNASTAVYLHGPSYLHDGIIYIELAADNNAPFYLQSLSFFSKNDPDAIIALCMALNGCSSAGSLFHMN